MKNIKWLSGAFIMALGLLVFGACSDDDEKETPSFPEKTAIDCAVGEVKTLTFHAENAWTLASSRLWCKFKDGNDVVSSLSGGPGEQTVTVTVTEDTWGFEDAIANIIMGMDGQAQTIAVVNRAAKGYKAEAYKMVDQNKVIYDASNPAVVPYKGDMEIYFEANFGWKLENCPEWLKVSSTANALEEITMMGDAGQITSWLLQFNPTAEYSKGPEQNIVLKFVDSNGAIRLEVPLKYDGIPDDEIEFTPKSPWSVVFSGDGKEYWQGGGDGSVKHNPAPRVVTAISKEGFELVYLRYDPEWGYTPCGDWDIPNLWFKAEIDGEQIKMSVESNEDKERKGCLMAFPKKVYENLGDIAGILEKFEGVDVVKSEYVKYIVADFTQEVAQSSGGFTVSFEGQPLTAEYVGDNPDSSAAYGTTNIYSIILPPSAQSKWLSITPNDYPSSSCVFEIGNAFQWNLTSDDFEKEGKTVNMLIPSMEGSADIVFKNPEGETFGVLMLQLWNE